MPMTIKLTIDQCDPLIKTVSRTLVIKTKPLRTSRLRRVLSKTVSRTLVIKTKPLRTSRLRRALSKDMIMKMTGMRITVMSTRFGVNQSAVSLCGASVESVV